MVRRICRIWRAFALLNDLCVAMLVIIVVDFPEIASLFVALHCVSKQLPAFVSNGLHA